MRVRLVNKVSASTVLAAALALSFASPSAVVAQTSSDPVPAAPASPAPPASPNGPVAPPASPASPAALPPAVPPTASPQPQPASTPPAPPQQQAQPSIPPQPPAGTPAVVVDANMATAILGKSVRSNAGEDMGRIVDVVVANDGIVRAAIIDFGGFLGVGSRKVAVDWRGLQFSLDGKPGVITIGLTRNQVRLSPEYKSGEPFVILGPAATVEAAAAPSQAPAAAPVPTQPAATPAPAAPPTPVPPAALQPPADQAPQPPATDPATPPAAPVGPSPAPAGPAR